MFSRFFSNIHFRRVLCCLLALLTFGCCLSPALVQPAEAIAVADDILIASLGLLAVSWAGITFNTNGGANSAISRLFESKPAVKLSLAGLLTKKLIVDGTKLLLTSDVRDVFNTILPDIKSAFPSDTSSGSDYQGSYYENVPIGFPVPISDQSLPNVKTDPVAFDCYDMEKLKGCKFLLDGELCSFGFSYPSGGWSSYYFAHFDRLSDGERLLSFSSEVHYFSLWQGKENIRIVSPRKTYSTHGWWDDFLFPFSSLTIVEAPEETFKYMQSKEVDGTQIQEITWGVQFVPDPNDPTEPTKPDDGSGPQRIPVWPLGPVQTPFDPNISQETANQDPGLSPEEMIAELKKLLEGQQTGGGDGGTTNPDPNPNPNPDPGPDTPGGADAPPNFNQMVTPNLKDFFPFCIPGDIKKMIDALCAAPEAPKFTFATSFMGQVYSVNIDLSAWNGVAASVRYMVVAVYIAALAVATRKFIKW